MGKKPKLNEFNYLLKLGKDFEITGREYEEKTGAPLPKGKGYIINSSALSRWASDAGFFISDVKENAVIERTVYFRRKRK